MKHAQTIALARRLLADGRTADVVRMLEPLVGDAGADGSVGRDAGGAVLRALLARCRVLRYGDPERAVAALAPIEPLLDGSRLPPLVEAEVELWLGWAEAWPDARHFDAAKALARFRRVEATSRRCHDAIFRAWAVLGRAQVYRLTDEPGLLAATLEELPLAPLTDSVAELVRLDLSAVLARGEGHWETVRCGADRLIDEGRRCQEPLIEGRGYAHRAVYLAAQNAGGTEVIAASRCAEELLTEAATVPAEALADAARARYDTLRAAGRADEARSYRSRIETALAHWSPDAAFRTNRLSSERGAARTAPLFDGGNEPYELVYASALMHALVRRLHAARTARRPVTLSGERGTGKERIARWLHAHGAGPEAPFVVFDASTMPSEYAAQALFGADASPGAFERADGGTLFVRDVADVPRELQKTLARRLSATETPWTGRLILGAQEPLERLSAAGIIPNSLAGLLQFAPIHLPPLRERRADIPLLARALLEELQAPGTPIAALTDDALHALIAYDWPGNVRQLRNELDRALTEIRTEPAPVIDLPHLSPLLREVASDVDVIDRPPETLELYLKDGQSLDDLLAVAETSIIERVLAAHEGQVTASAQALGLTRQGLYKKMKRLGIDPSAYHPVPTEDTLSASA